MFNLRPPGQKPLLGTPIDGSNLLSKGLVGAWVMNEDSGNVLNDQSNNGNNGTLVGGTARFQTGNLRLNANDATTDYVALDKRAITKSISEAITVFMKFKTSDEYGPLFALRNLAAGPIFALLTGFDGVGADPGKLLAITRDSAGAGLSRLNCGFRIDDNQWRTAVLQLVNTDFEMYINGILVDSDTTTAGVRTFGADYQAIGAELKWITDVMNTADQRYLDCEIECAYYYNRQLTNFEITSLHADPYQMWPDYALWMAGVLAGWAHKWNGIAGASITAINGVSTANVTKVNGI